MIGRKNSKPKKSLAKVLDRLLEQGAKKQSTSFRRLAETAKLDPSRDFIGASLCNIDMRDEDLRGFDFSKADLTGADFRRANVQGVRFHKANLTGVIGLREPIKAQSNPQVLDLGEVLSDLSMLLRRLIGEKILLEIVRGRNLWPVKVDISNIEQVIAELAVNARDAMPDGGKLRLRTSNVRAARSAKSSKTHMSSNDYVLIEVSDTGLGIAPGYHDRIFRPYFQAGNSLKRKGMGLGLYMANEYTKRMNGFLSLESEFGRGAKFNILLPRYVPDGADQPEIAPLVRPNDFDLTKVHEMILAGKAVPKTWVPFILELDFSYEDLKKLDQIGDLDHLESLNIEATSVRNLAPIAKLRNLQILNLSITGVKDLRPLKQLSKLRSLSLADARIRDVTALARLTNLQYLNLSGTLLLDLSPLAELKNIRILNLHDTRVSDLSPLTQLEKLKSLDVAHTMVADVAPLARLKHLEKLDLSVTFVKDTSAVAHLKKLKIVQTSQRA